MDVTQNLGGLTFRTCYLINETAWQRRWDRQFVLTLVFYRVRIIELRW